MSYVTSETSDGTYITVNGQRKWPSGKEKENMNKGDMYPVSNVEFEVDETSSVRVQLWEWDWGSGNDPMGFIDVCFYTTPGNYLLTSPEGEAYILSIRN